MNECADRGCWGTPWTNQQPKPEIGRQGARCGQETRKEACGPRPQRVCLGDAEATARWGSEEVEVRRIGEDEQTLAFPGEGACRRRAQQGVVRALAERARQVLQLGICRDGGG